jgi:hypothetical protein
MIGLHSSSTVGFSCVSQAHTIPQLSLLLLLHALVIS